MTPETTRLWQRCVRLMLKPVIRFCMRHSLKIQELIDCCKAAFLELAKEDLGRQGKKVTISRLSIITGLHRRDVLHYQRQGSDVHAPRNLITKVVGLWQTDPQFITKNKAPRVLTAGDEDSEFSKLVRKVSQDLGPATVLFELERVNAIEHTPQGVRLASSSYTPKGDADALFSILSEDLSDLSAAVEENVFEPPQVKNLHARTVYDRVRADKLLEVRQWLLREGHALHTRARNFLSRLDQDITPDSSFSGKTIKVILGSFGRIQSENTHSQETSSKKMGPRS